MIRPPKLGLLPLYLKLYDEKMPEIRREFGYLIEGIERNFTDDGLEVVRADVCCVEAQFREAVRRFEQEDVDTIVTLHLAYSPSLESADALAGTAIPLLMLDTTSDFDFGPLAHPQRIMMNHGIHGVQDLASVLRRRGKAFNIVAGHCTESDVLYRASNMVRAAYAARLFRKCRVLRIGEPFAGMGDFAVPDAVLGERLGITVDQLDLNDLEEAVNAVAPGDVEEEIRNDNEFYAVEIPRDVHERSVRVSLGLRELLDEGEYDAFTMNFLAFDNPKGLLNTVPFLEASKAMGRGLGYAGEGDALTAALVGACNAAFGMTTFTETFCPDWKGNSLFVSHMGEINPEVASEQPRLHEKPFPWTRAKNPAVLSCAIEPGPAVLVNLAPGPGDAFGLIIAPVDVIDAPDAEGMRDTIRGWIRPACEIDEFLEVYSRYGGTHHSALMLNDCEEALMAFGAFVNVEVFTI